MSQHAYNSSVFELTYTATWHINIRCNVEVASKTSCQSLGWALLPSAVRAVATRPNQQAQRLKSKPRGVGTGPQEPEHGARGRSRNTGTRTGPPEPGTEGQGWAYEAETAQPKSLLS